MEVQNESKECIYFIERENMNSESTLSIIIVSYNCLDMLKQCIASIEKYNDIGERLEVIVVDNSSDSEIEEWSRQCTQKIQFIINENKGFGQANNVGAAMATGEILLFLNPDTELVEPVFGYVLSRFKKDEKLGMLGLKLRNRQKTYTPSMSMRFHYGFLKGTVNTILTRLDIFLPSIMCTSGADIFIRHELFDEVGRFDENLFMYCEEPDLTNRVNKAGMKNAYDKSKTILHHEAGTSEGMSKRYRQRTEAYRYYCKKYGIDFEKQQNKENVYCKLKARLFRLAGKNEKADEYELICKAVSK